MPCRGAAGALEARDGFDGFDDFDDGALRPCDRGAFGDLGDLPVEGRWAGLAPRGGLPPRRGGREDGLIAALPA